MIVESRLVLDGAIHPTPRLSLVGKGCMASLSWIPPMLGGIAFGAVIAISPWLRAPARPEAAPSAQPSRAATPAQPVTPSRRHSAEERRRDVAEAAAAQAARIEQHRQEPR